MDAVDIFLADKPGDDDVCPQRHADKQTQHHGDNRAVAADGRHSLLSDKLAEHGDVGGVEQLLHNTRKGEGQGYDEDFIPQRAFQHIHFSCSFFLFDLFHINLIMHIKVYSRQYKNDRQTLHFLSAGRFLCG